MPVSIQQQVLRLEIAVDDVHAVEVIEGQGDFGRVELRNRVGEALLNLVSTEYAKLLPLNVNGSPVTFVAS